MQEKWEIVYYKSAQGKMPVRDFVGELEMAERAKVSAVLDLLVEYGVKVRGPHVKKLIGTDFWELRTLGGGNVRIFYVTMVRKKFLLLHGFKKKKQKTDKKELKIASDRLVDYKLRLKQVLHVS